MYSEGNRRTAPGRANDEFLRRMLGGELVGTLPVMNTTPAPRPPLPDYGGNNTACDGTRRNSQNGSCPDNSCPTKISAPALAMVYSPRQCWQNLFDPMQGLKHGTIFAELVLPLEAGKPKNGMEVRTRK